MACFGWQWKRVDALKSNIEEGDVFDVDGDLKEERIVKVHLSGDRVISVDVSDPQNADIDMSYDTYDKSLGKLSSGLTNETMFSAIPKIRGLRGREPICGLKRENCLIKIISLFVRFSGGTPWT